MGRPMGVEAADWREGIRQPVGSKTAHCKDIRLTQRRTTWRHSLFPSCSCSEHLAQLIFTLV